MRAACESICCFSNCCSGGFFIRGEARASCLSENLSLSLLPDVAESLGAACWCLCVNKTRYIPRGSAAARQRTTAEGHWHSWGLNSKDPGVSYVGRFRSGNLQTSAERAGCTSHITHLGCGRGQADSAHLGSSSRRATFNIRNLSY